MISEPLNSVTLSGVVVKEPKLGNADGRPVCRLYLRMDDWEEAPPVEVVFSGDKTEFCKGVQPGDCLALVGRLVLRDWSGPRPEVEVQGRNGVLLVRAEATGEEKDRAK